MRYQQNSAAEAAPLDRGLMVLEPASRRFCALNPTSTLIWSRLAEPASPEQVAEYIADHFQGVSPAAALQDVRAIIDEMAAAGIVVPSPE
jgi:Coenzyme PQQ synthesis protein D (PqqD)